jgi:uncharacterized protein (TIGR02001 family)
VGKAQGVRGLRILLAAGLVVGAASAALAADWGSLSANMDVTSDYRFRGLSNNSRQPALQGGIDWNFDGWHAGLWSSMIDFKDRQNTRVELDVSAGKQVTLRGTIVDFAVTYYSYPLRNRPHAAPLYSYAEAIMKASHSWGDFTLNGETAWSPNSFGETGMSWDLRAGASYQLLDWLSASANIGRQWVKDTDAVPGSGYPYTHWDAGLTASYRKLSLDLRYVDSTLSRRECLLSVGGADWCEAGAVATLSYTFGD